MKKRSTESKAFQIAAFILLFLTTPLFGSGSYNYGSSWLTTFLSRSIILSILSIVGALTTVSILIIIFSIKLKKVNRELDARNKIIEDINNDLQKSNSELANQNNLITKEYSESDKFYQILVQSAEDGISFYDRNWILKYANPAFYSLIGLDKETYSALYHKEIIHPEDIGYHEKRLEALNNTGFFEAEIRLRHANGKYVNLLSRSVTVKDDNGEILGALTISRDITKLKQVHDELIEANAEVEASNRLKTSFLSNISHEIRTPLNSVVGFSNLLLGDNITKELREEYIEHISHNSDKLLQIIGDILDLSRLESSQIEIKYKETSLNGIINEITEEAKQVILRNEKPIILNVRNQFTDDGDLIFTDRVWLKRVLNHLMDNAIKFTFDGSIDFSSLKENGNIVFKIKDTGIGINQENLSQIFEVFRQEINGNYRLFDGLGIGLTLAREVVERMGGKIFVQSEKGVGSEFSFSIPYRPAHTIGLNTKSTGSDYRPAPRNWSSHKCLIVDDNKEILIYLNRILIDTGITVLTARTGHEAIEIVQNHKDIDVILLDIQMPEMNGIEAAREIRKIDSNIPIIAQTAFIFEDDKDIILEAGCDALLLKPIRREHLLSVMAGFIKAN